METVDNHNGRIFERLSTGNEHISLPDIRTADAGVLDAGFLHMALRGWVELHGSGDCPLLKPVIELDGQDLFGRNVEAELVSCWVPRFTVDGPVLKARATIFAPLDRRGFAAALELENKSSEKVTVKAGWRGCWQLSRHTASLSRPISGTNHAHISSRRAGVAVMEFRGQTPLFAMAVAGREGSPSRIWGGASGEEITEWTSGGITTPAGSPVCYEITDEHTLAPGEKIALPAYVGIGLEEVSAVASAHEMRLQGWERLLQVLVSWLDNHIIDHDDDYLKRLMNTNSFYNYFFSQGLTLDSEELVVTLARSSRNDSCGIYRSREALMWSLPAVLQIDWAQARKMLIYAFTTQLANVGIRSRFIDGIVLEPGLQLDLLCSPVRALYLYVQRTGDMSVLFDRRVQTGINSITQVLMVQRHPSLPLYETLLLPSGEPSKLPYVCYSNVLVWRVLTDLHRLYVSIRDIDRAEEALRLADRMRSAIVEHFIVPGPSGDMFAMSVDLHGGYEHGDDPRGSIQLMPYFDFCSAQDPVYRNTVAWIYSEHNPNFGCGYPLLEPSQCARSAPSVIGVVNDLLAGRQKDALEFLRGVHLDDGIACESVDARTGRSMSGEACASIAGYLAYGLCQALDADVPDAATAGLTRRPGESLSQPPPEAVRDSRKGRL